VFAPKAAIPIVETIYEAGGFALGDVIAIFPTVNKQTARGRYKNADTTVCGMYFGKKIEKLFKLSCPDIERILNEQLVEPECETPSYVKKRVILEDLTDLDVDETPAQLLLDLDKFKFATAKKNATQCESVFCTNLLYNNKCTVSEKWKSVRTHGISAKPITIPGKVETLVTDAAGGESKIVLSGNQICVALDIDPKPYVEKLAKEGVANVGCTILNQANRKFAKRTVKATVRKTDSNRGYTLDVLQIEAIPGARKGRSLLNNATTKKELDFVNLKRTFAGTFGRAPWEYTAKKRRKQN